MVKEEIAMLYSLRAAMSLAAQLVDEVEHRQQRIADYEQSVEENEMYIENLRRTLANYKDESEQGLAEKEIKNVHLHVRKRLCLQLKRELKKCREQLVPNSVPPILLARQLVETMRRRYTQIAEPYWQNVDFLIYYLSCGVAKNLSAALRHISNNSRHKFVMEHESVAAVKTVYEQIGCGCESFNDGISAELSALEQSNGSVPPALPDCVSEFPEGLYMSMQTVLNKRMPTALNMRIELTRKIDWTGQQLYGKIISLNKLETKLFADNSSEQHTETQ